MKKNFKSHMVLWADSGEGFRTMCGIGDNCSEKFRENAILVDFGDEKETTCKNCLNIYKLMLLRHDKTVGPKACTTPCSPSDWKPGGKCEASGCFQTDLVECLKLCNLKLDALRTADNRFVAWIIYSTQHECFIAGVDTYSNSGENLLWVIAKSAEHSPIEAIKQIYLQICKWESAGEVPLNAEDIF